MTANDADPEGHLQPGTVTVTAVPVSGSLFVDPASGVITYLPSSGFTGDDEFSYRVADAEGLVDTAHVVVHVLPGNQPPVADDDAARTDEDVPVVIDVLANDDDPDGDLDPSSVTIVAPPSHGLLQVDGQSGAVTYRPEADFFGTDRFVYRVSDTLRCRGPRGGRRSPCNRSAIRRWPTMIWRRRTRMCRWSSMCWPTTRMPMEISTRPACRSSQRRSTAWRK